MGKGGWFSLGTDVSRDIGKFLRRYLRILVLAQATQMKGMVATVQWDVERTLPKTASRH